MSFSPFHVSCGFFLFWWLLLFCSLLSGASYGSFLSFLWATFSVVVFFWCCVFCWAVFHTTLSLLVLFSPVCWDWIHSLFSFFSLGLFFGLPVFSDSILNNLQRQGLFLGLSLFSVSVDFSCSEGSFSLFFSTEFPCVCYRGFLPSGSVLSSRAALSSENACYCFLCRWHVTATLTGWFHP